MSKAFAFAGARVGYLAADAAVVDALRLVRLALPPISIHPSGGRRRSSSQRSDVADCRRYSPATRPHR
jgi:hypothetical protein